MIGATGQRDSTQQQVVRDALAQAPQGRSGWTSPTSRSSSRRTRSSARSTARRRLVRHRRGRGLPARAHRVRPGRRRAAAQRHAGRRPQPAGGLAPLPRRHPLLPLRRSPPRRRAPLRHPSAPPTRDAMPLLDERDVRLLEVLAGVIAGQLEHEHQYTPGARVRPRARLDHRPHRRHRLRQPARRRPGRRPRAPRWPSAPGADWVAPEHLSRIADAVDAGGEGNLARYEVDLLRFDGSRVPVEIAAAPLTDATGEPIGRVAMITDLTERRAAEELSEARFRWLADLIDHQVWIATPRRSPGLRQRAGARLLRSRRPSSSARTTGTASCTRTTSTAPTGAAAAMHAGVAYEFQARVRRPRRRVPRAPGARLPGARRLGRGGPLVRHHDRPDRRGRPGAPARVRGPPARGPAHRPHRRVPGDPRRRARPVGGVPRPLRDDPGELRGLGVDPRPGAPRRPAPCCPTARRATRPCAPSTTASCSTSTRSASCRSA